MAIFLTIGLLEVLAGRIEPGAGLLTLFVSQMGVGALVGAAAGWLTVRIMNRINLDAAGLYPVLAAACGFVAFGLASMLGGSGFLSIYLAGIIVGNSRIVFQRGTFLFMDGLAWIGQIAMFVVLGLLSTPSALLPVAGRGLLVAAVLIFIARPLAVVPLLLPFRFSWREHLLISWVGLKGAVPIILATFPLMADLPDAPLIFNIVFFVVLVSATLQGWTLAPIASRLRLEETSTPEPSVSLELLTLRNVDAEIADYHVPPDSPLAGRSVADLRLPEGAVLAMITRGTTLIAPRGGTEVRPGDHLFVISRTETRPALEAALGRVAERRATGTG
jgi:cell volume regulation protein A